VSTRLHRTPALIEIRPAPPRQQALPDQVYATLKHRLLTCELKPGHKLVEADLAAEPGLSRTPLREALNRLGHEGLVVLAAFRGYTVAPLTLRDFHELCEVRRLVEPEVAALAAQRASPRDVERLLAL
jgi:GntR family transcriptional regulator, rspAB operon transcriptional repressor